MKFKGIALIMAGICIIVFLLQVLYPQLTDALLLSQNSFYEPWRFITAMFVHGGAGHLLYNMLALALFGSILEAIIGGKKFTLVYFITGLLANIISINFYENSLGASGAIFGVIGALIIIRPTMTVWAFGLPMPMILAGVLWAIGDAIGIFFPSGTANIAHLAGLFFGLIFGFMYRENKVSSTEKDRVYLDERYMQRWEDYHLK